MPSTRLSILTSTAHLSPQNRATYPSWRKATSTTDGNFTTGRQRCLLLLKVAQLGVGLSRARVAQMRDSTMAMGLEGATA